MAHWLLKTEPSDYSFANLQSDKKTLWTGVKNALARKHLRAMKPGDELLIYHTGDEKAVVGLARVTKANVNDEEPAVEIAAVSAFIAPVTLARLKQDKQFADWGLIKIGRLSVVPTPPEIFSAVVALSGKAGR